MASCPRLIYRLPGADLSLYVVNRSKTLRTAAGTDEPAGKKTMSAVLKKNTPETLQQHLSLSVCAPQRSWVCKCRTTYCFYWPSCLCCSLSTNQKACSIFQYATCVNISVSNMNLLTVTASPQLFLKFSYYDWSLVSEIHVTDCVNRAEWTLPTLKLIFSGPLEKPDLMGIDLSVCTLHCV